MLVALLVVLGVVLVQSSASPFSKQDSFERNLERLAEAFKWQKVPEQTEATKDQDVSAEETSFEDGENTAQPNMPSADEAGANAVVHNREQESQKLIEKSDIEKEVLPKTFVTINGETLEGVRPSWCWIPRGLCSVGTVTHIEYDAPVLSSGGEVNFSIVAPAAPKDVSIILKKYLTPEENVSFKENVLKRQLIPTEIAQGSFALQAQAGVYFLFMNNEWPEGSVENAFKIEIVE